MRQRLAGLGPRMTTDPPRDRIRRTHGLVPLIGFATALWLVLLIVWVAPARSEASAFPTSPPSKAQINGAVAYARNLIGQDIDYEKCLLFIEQAYQSVGYQIGSVGSANGAVDWWNDNVADQHAGDLDPPVGALVFWGPTGATSTLVANPYGHVGISVGSGQVVSTYSYPETTTDPDAVHEFAISVRNSYDGGFYPYLGWIMPGAGAASVPPADGAPVAREDIDPSTTFPSDQIQGVSCPTTGFCLAVDTAGNDFIFSDGSWSPGPPILVSDPESDIDSVSCASSNLCVAVDGHSGNLGGGYVYTYSGATWSAGEQIDFSGGLVGVDCPTSTFCMALDGSGATFRDKGGQWSSGPKMQLRYAVIGPSCTSSSFCMAVDNGGNEYTFNKGRWASPRKIDPGVADFLTAVTCPSTSYCVALDDQSGRTFIYSKNRWSVGPQLDDNASGLSCASTSFCIAVGNRGYAFVYSHGHWGSGQFIDPTSAASGAGLTQVSCASSSLCAALDTDGEAVIYSHGRWYT